MSTFVAAWRLNIVTVIIANVDSANIVHSVQAVYSTVLLPYLIVFLQHGR